MAVLLQGCALLNDNSAATAEYARQVTTANLRVAQLENELAQSQARIEQLEEFVRVQGQSQATRLENLDEVNSEVSRLRGRIEVLEFELGATKDRFDAYEIQMERRTLHAERRLRQLEELLGVKAPPPPTDEELGLTDGSASPDPTDPDAVDPVVDPTDPDATDPDAAPTSDETVPDTASGKLELAASRMEEDKPAVARAILLRALTEHPDAPETDEIRYRLAETHFNQKDYRKAALAFKKVIDDHPKSDWAPWALLRQGECFAGLNQPDNARLFFDGVIQRYPKSEAAKEAKKRLNR
jgi:TolA-binding protein